VLGGIVLRHEFNDYVRWAGRIGSASARPHDDAA
jgi:lysine/ornithine N-monooxygenase